MSQTYTYPAISVTASNPANGTPGSIAPATATEVGGVDGTGRLRALSTDSSGNANVNVVSSTLPAGGATSANQTTEIGYLSTISTNTTGGATAANQTTEITKLTSIDGKTPALGQALSAASVPVVLPATQITALTPPTSVTVTQATGTNLHAVIDAGSANIGSITNVTGTVSLPTGASTSANQTNGTQKTQIATPTALTVTNAAITVGTTAVRLTVAGTAPAATRVVLVASPDTASTATFYIGNASVTNSGATRGIPIVVGQSFIANNDAGDYYIVSSVAAQTVEVLEQA